jgi:hypothetical protein
LLVARSVLGGRSVLLRICSSNTELLRTASRIDSMAGREMEHVAQDLVLGLELLPPLLDEAGLQRLRAATGRRRRTRAENRLVALCK